MGDAQQTDGVDLGARLDNISAMIAELSIEFRLFKAKLLGDDKDERPNGRIPILEATQARHERRLARIEAFVLMVFGGLAVVKAGGWVLESLYHLTGVITH